MSGLSDFTNAISEHWGGRPFEDMQKGFKYILDSYPEVCCPTDAPRWYWNADLVTVYSRSTQTKRSPLVRVGAATPSSTFPD